MALMTEMAGEREKTKFVAECCVVHLACMLDGYTVAQMGSLDRSELRKIYYRYKPLIKWKVDPNHHGFAYEFRFIIGEGDDTYGMIEHVDKNLFDSHSLGAVAEVIGERVHYAFEQYMAADDAA